MALAVGCEEMTRIVNDILVPEFLSLTHTLRKSGHRAEVVAYDAENPVYLGEMCDIGIKFRCGVRDDPCKIEFIADPNDFVFNATIRIPSSEEITQTWKFSAVIPRNLRVIIADFMETHFPEVEYTPKTSDFDQHDASLKGPFTVETEEEGRPSEVAKTESMQEAISMAASMIKMFEGKPLHIVDSEGNIVC